jgi:hypothetical protein
MEYDCSLDGELAMRLMIEMGMTRACWDILQINALPLICVWLLDLMVNV